MNAGRTRVKICGITRLEDGLAAVRYGVDALGFILYAGSPRYISSEKAGAICDKLPPFVDRIGVLVNENIDLAVELVNRVGFSYLQLHGGESEMYCRELKKRLPLLKIFKAFRVGEQSRTEDFLPYEQWVDGFLLDTYLKGEIGGTGEIFNWSILEHLDLKCPVILAGGLSPENISQAIFAVQPYAVDVNSGVETEPGKKDHGRMKELMNRVSKTTLL